MTEQTLGERLATLGFRETPPGGWTPGRDHYLRCPWCSDHRKPANRKKQCLTLRVDDDGQGAVWHCHNCAEGTGNLPGTGGRRDDAPRRREYRPAKQPPADPTPHNAIIQFFKNRGISQEVVEFLGIYGTRRIFPQDFDAGPKAAITYPYRLRGQVVSNKYRSAKKEFVQDKETMRVLYNGDSLLDADQAIWVEGENDVAAVLEGLGLNTAVVSLPDGAPSTHKEELDRSDRRYEAIENCAELLAPIQKHIIATDGDEAGNALAHQLALRFGIGRCFRVRWPHDAKDPDPNGVLQAYGKDILRSLIEHAPGYPTKGLWEVTPGALIDWRKSPRLKTYSVGLAGLDEILRFRPGQVVIGTGYPGEGKTEFMLWVMTELSRQHNWHWMICSPEHQKEELGELIAEKWAGEPSRDYGLNLRGMSDERMAQAEAWIGPRFSFVWQEDDTQPMTLDWIFEQARVDHLRRGINGLLIDPYNQIEHEQAKMKETDYVRDLIRRLRWFAHSYNAMVVLLAHPQKLMREAKTGKRPVPALQDISGSSHFHNMCDVGWCCHRDDKTKHEVTLYVQKMKRKDQGHVGQVTLEWIKETGRYQLAP